MNEGWSFDKGSLLYLVYVVHEEGYRSCGKVGNFVGDDYSIEVFLPSDVSVDDFSCRACGGVCKLWCASRPLHSCIHVSFIVKADVDNIIPSLKGTG